MTTFFIGFALGAVVTMALVCLGMYLCTRKTHHG